MSSQEFNNQKRIIEEKNKCLIENFKILNQLFNKHKITYWLDWGTLLGAVREKKIIDWDTDIDIGIIDNSYKKVLSIIPEIEKHGFYLRKSIIKEANFHISRNGCYIDIWPYKTKNDKVVSVYAYSLDNKSLLIIWQINYCVKTKLKYIVHTKGSTKSKILTYLICALVKIPSKIKIFKKFIINLTNNILKKNVTLLKLTVPKKFFENLKTINFYGIKTNIPADIEKYLIFKYGKNWRIPDKKWLWKKTLSKVKRI